MTKIPSENSKQSINFLRGISLAKSHRIAEKIQTVLSGDDLLTLQEEVSNESAKEEEYTL